MLILFDYVTILTQNLGINPRGCLDNSYDGPKASTYHWHNAHPM